MPKKSHLQYWAREGHKTYTDSEHEQPEDFQKYREEVTDYYHGANRESAKFKSNLLGTPHTFNVTIYTPILTCHYVLELLTEIRK
jgi:hypothetical protein